MEGKLELSIGGVTSFGDISDLICNSRPLDLVFMTILDGGLSALISKPELPEILKNIKKMLPKPHHRY